MKSILIVACMLLLASTRVYAMSATPETKCNDLTAAERDAKEALASGDKRLLGLGLKKLSLPGLQASQYAAAQEACGVRILQSNDVVSSDDDARKISESVEYASEYNRWIISHCLD